MNLKCFVFRKANTPFPAAFLLHDCTEPFIPEGGIQSSATVLALLFCINQNKGSSFQLKKQLFLDIICFLCNISLGQQSHSYTNQVPPTQLIPGHPFWKPKASLPERDTSSGTAQTLLAGRNQKGATCKARSGPGSSHLPKACTKQALQVLQSRL